MAKHAKSVGPGSVSMVCSAVGEGCSLLGSLVWLEAVKNDLVFNTYLVTRGLPPSGPQRESRAADLVAGEF